MAKIVQLLIALALLGAGLGAAGCGNTGGSDARPVLGRPAPDFTLATTDGRSVSLSSLKGKPVMLNFWATWCGPCRDEIPFLQAIAADAAWTDRGLAMVAVDLQEPADDVRQFMADYGMTYTVLLDTEGEVAGLYNISGIPTTYFIDKDGIIKYVKTGAFTRQQEIELILAGTIMKE
jgi:cytochrome c biogenesis protein CcmG, thiol:disulfide interchange protein DsbE